LSREVRMAREFRTLKYGFYGRVEAAMRTCERHEMSEKMSVCETSMPSALVRVISR